MLLHCVDCRKKTKTLHPTIFRSGIHYYTKGICTVCGKRKHKKNIFRKIILE